jgi:hypothetical protein
VGRHGFSCRRFRESEEYANLRNEVLARLTGMAASAMILTKLSPPPISASIRAACPVWGKDLTMQQLVGFAGMLLAASAGAGQPGHLAVQSATASTPAGVMAGQHNDAAGLSCETRARHTPAPKLEVTITPPKVKIPDNSERGTHLAKVAVRWSNGKPFSGEVRLTKNPGGICQLSGMELQLGRDTTKDDDYRTRVCTVTAIK